MLFIANNIIIIDAIIYYFSLKQGFCGGNRNVENRHFNNITPLLLPFTVTNIVEDLHVIPERFYILSEK